MTSGVRAPTQAAGLLCFVKKHLGYKNFGRYLMPLIFSL